MCVGDDVGETRSRLRLDRGPSRDVRRAARFRRDLCDGTADEIRLVNDDGCQLARPERCRA